MKKKLFFLILSTLAILMLAACSSGAAINTDTSMEMSHNRFSGTETRTVFLSADTEVTVGVVTNGGRVDLEVIGDNGITPFHANNFMTNTVAFTISEDGYYTISIVGNSHNGSVNFSWE